MSPLRLIPHGYRKGASAVTLLILLRAVMDLVGIAALIPILILAADPDALSSDSFLASLYRYSGLADHHRFIVALCCAVLALVLLKGLVNIAISQYTSGYILSLYRFYSRRMFENYHDRGLLFLKSRNSAKLAYEINYVCMNFVQGVLTPIAAMICDAVMLALMFAALVLYDYKVALLLAALFVPVALVYIYIVRGKIQNYGQRENEIRRTQNRLVMEAFKGYAEIEINDGFRLFSDRFAGGLGQIASLRQRYMLVRQIPSLLIEVCIVAVLSAMVIMQTDAVLLGVFAVAAIKVLPSVKNLITGYITIKNNRYCARIIERSADAPVHGAQEPITFDREIAVEGVSFAFPDDERTVLSDLNMTVRKGECLGINGVSGGGKTTLFNLLLGFYPPQKGRILVDGVELSDANVRSWRALVGYVPQEVFITDSTVARNVALGEAEPDAEKVIRALDAARLSEFVASLPDGIDTPIGECGARLSGGQKQRIGIARALYKGARILFFDEATSSLDSRTESDVNDSIRALLQADGALTVIMIAHRESSLAVCDRVVTI